MTEHNESFSDVPDRWLRTFTAVARTNSFTGAAEQLGVSQPAVSHTIGRLEKRIGSSLFVRSGRTVQLTLVGVALLSGTGPAFDQLDQAVSQVHRMQLDDSAVALSVSTSLASYWLMPRLPAFKAQHPDCDLRVITNDTDRGVGHDDADLWIPLGLGPWSHLRSWNLFAEQIYPVASPSYVAEVPSLIHLEERYTERFNWERWLSIHDTPGVFERGPTSNDYSVVIQSAIEGQGVALGWDHIVGPLVSQGLLVRVGSEEVNTDHAFPVLAKPGHLRKAAQQMLSWLLEQAT